MDSSWSLSEPGRAKKAAPAYEVEMYFRMGGNKAWEEGSDGTSGSIHSLRENFEVCTFSPRKSEEAPSRRCERKVKTEIIIQPAARARLLRSPSLPIACIRTATFEVEASS